MSWRSEKRRSRFATFSNVSVDSAPTGDSHAAAPGTTADADAQGGLLPSPVVARPASSKAVRRARVEEKPRVRWAQFVRRIGAGSAPTESSVLNASMCSSSTAIHHTARKQEEDEGPTEVDEVIVERAWEDDLKLTVSDPNEVHEKSNSQKNGGTGTDRDSVAGSVWTGNLVLVTLRYRVWPMILDFFAARYVDEKTERHFEKEHWFYRKALGFWTSLFLVGCWVLTVALLPRPFTTIDKWFYFLVAPFFTLPITFMIMWDWPREGSFKALLYQFFITVTTWMWPLYLTITMYICGYYTTKDWVVPCGNKSFFLLAFYLAAFQSIGLFGLHLNRISSLIGCVVFIALTAVTIVPQSHAYSRNLIMMGFYEAFLLYVHYMSENSERRLYSLREQLKIQFRATQKAQVNERKASDSKRRLTSYVFHEVRVPLNTALLAVQNMEATGSVPKDQELEFKALTGSLSMMSKVLNDVLDFNRMDSGRFESVARPFAFHQVMKSMFVPLQMATNARGLELETDLDDNIDLVAQRALYEAGDLPASEITTRLSKPNDEEGFVVGDETRLRQIITNLASNACKFTPTGGRLRIRTKLIHPVLSALPPSPPAEASPDPLADTFTSEGHGTTEDVEANPHGLSTDRLDAHNRQTAPPHATDHVVVRIEVTDTGSGIRPRDMADSKLFSAFNQTELGRLQGGKGTGLGLALVRQIVKLSGGRLGLMSRTGENSGSTFWVELPFGVGAKALGGLPGGTQALLRSPSQRRAPPADPVHEREGSALHRIMDQGGLVELLADGVAGGSGVITRTLADPSMGTQTLRLEPPGPRRPPLLTRETSEATAVGTPVAERSSPPCSATAEKAPLAVLVVDDDPLTRTLMKRLLTRLGCAVDTAEHGGAGLARALAGTYAVVFLDNQMPVMTGVEAVAALRAAGRDDFVVGVTGNALLSDQEEYLAAGVDHVLTKPVLERNLRAMLTQAEERLQRATAPGGGTGPVTDKS